MLQKISISQFRNIREAELEIHPGMTLVVGRNGQGKTNLLEAIHVVTQGWSFRTRSPEEWIQWEQEECVVRITGQSAQGSMSQALRVNRKNGIETRVGEKSAKSLSALYGEFPCVYMGPEDIALVRGSPEHRRRWVDVLLCRRYAEGMDLLRRYRRVLQQRNRWLKDHKGGSADEVYQVLTQQYVELWSQIALYRYQVVDECSPVVTAHYGVLSGGAEAIRMVYRGGASLQEPLISRAELQEKLMRKMQGLQGFELIHGVSGAGAHKDDLELIFSHGHDLRTAGSQGQCRSAALAMGFTTLDYTRQWSSGSTLLLLDDIFAELDTHRRQAVSALISTRNSQVLAALPRAEDLPFAGDQRVDVDGGGVGRVREGV